jgi:hypothetical protein
MATFEEFKNCCLRELHLDLEALDVAFFEPLADVFEWYSKLSLKAQAFVTGLLGRATTNKVFAEALEAFLAKALNKGLAAASKSVTGLLTLASIAVAAGIALGVLLQVAGACTVDPNKSPTPFGVGP